MPKFSAKIVVLLVAGACLASCATDGAWVNVTTEASSSPYFNLSQPGVYKVEGGLELEGRVCRLARSTVLSPSGVRLEHIGANGARIDVERAGVAPIYRGADQACSDYATRVTWALADGDSVRACFDHGYACPADPAAKAIVAVPAVPEAAAPIGNK